MIASHAKQLSKDSFFYSLPKILPAVGMLILTPVYTVFMTPTDYGVLAMLAAVGQVLSLVMWLNMNTGVLRFYHDYQDEERRRFLGTVAVGSLVFSGLVCVGLIMGGDYLTRAVFKSDAIAFWPMVAAQIAIVFFGTAIIVPAAILKNERKVKEWCLIQIGSWLFSTALSVYFIAVMHDGAWGKIKAQLIVAIILFVVYWVITLAHATPYFSWTMFRENLLFGLPILGKGFSAYVYQFSDRWIMERFVPLAHIGLFSLGDSFARLLQMGQAAFADAWMPYFYAEAKRDAESAAHLVKEIAYYWSVLMAVLTVVLCLFIRPVVLILANERFHDPIVISSAQLLIVAYFVASLQVFLIYALSFSKKNMPILTTAVIAAAANLAINLLVIPHFGVLAAAWSRILAYTLNLILLYRAAQHVFPVDYPLSSILRLFLLGASAFALSVFTKTAGMAAGVLKDTVIFGGFVSALFLFGLLDYKKLRSLVVNQIVSFRVRTSR
jgi:O-antigen/teichoic acid export membrane protein